MSTSELPAAEGGERAFGDLTRRVIHGEERLSEIISRFEAKFEKLNDSIQELNRTIAAVGKPDYKTWSALAGICCTVIFGLSWMVWILVITPINDQIKTIVPRDTHIEKWAQFDREIQRLESDMKNKASKDDLNQKVFELIQRSPKK